VAESERNEIRLFLGRGFYLLDGSGGSLEVLVVARCAVTRAFVEGVAGGGGFGFGFSSSLSLSDSDLDSSDSLSSVSLAFAGVLVGNGPRITSLRCGVVAAGVIGAWTVPLTDCNEIGAGTGGGISSDSSSDSDSVSTGFGNTGCMTFGFTSSSSSSSLELDTTGVGTFGAGGPEQIA
jgi:hypothetical protein